jgi:EAL domain-containing protein (putative c-di-GMP-specific phosphodiesterase class I)
MASMPLLRPLIKALGVNILIDDFGTAYSSLNYLSQFKVDVLKIDISFIRRMTTQKSDEAIVRAIITMAHSLNMKTIAEGVETEEQLQILRHLDCDMSRAFCSVNRYRPRIWLQSI